jgi:ubiquilin
MKAKILVSTGERLELEVPGTLTVLALRQRVIEAVPGLGSKPTFIYRYRGRVMDDGRTLSDLSFVDGDSVHVSIPVDEPASTMPTAARSPMGGMDANPLRMGLGGLGEQLAKDFMSDPAMLRSILLSNPQMKALVESNPEIGHILSDPNMLRQTMETARNPALMREMMRSSDRAMSNMESHPEGFNALRRMYSTIQEPLNQIGLGDDAADSQTSEQETTRSLQSETPNTTALPNPWARAAAGPGQGQGQQQQRAPFMPNFGGLGGLSGAFGATPGARPLAGHPFAPNPFEAMRQARAAAEAPLPPLPAPQGTSTGPGSTRGEGEPSDAIGMAAVLEAMQALRLHNERIRVQSQGEAQGQGASSSAQQPGAAPSAAMYESVRAAQLARLYHAGSHPHVDARLAPCAPGAPGPSQPTAGGRMRLIDQSRAEERAKLIAAETRYALELSVIADMGFDDKDSVLKALMETGGNINAAIARLTELTEGLHF